NIGAEAPQSNPIDDPNRRRNDRRRTLKEGQIVFNDRQSVIDCVVRNLSDKGACLEVTSPIGIPDFFDLDLGQSGFRSCRIAWRKSRRIGVTFP
ncbi:MAG: PilZ domain-containing protein, partial [Alphaproteobacteria bacterium]|nr:PilZ domain-containing protein [Alphaproteobacteria bacterium]